MYEDTSAESTKKERKPKLTKLEKRALKKLKNANLIRQFDIEELMKDVRNANKLTKVKYKRWKNLCIDKGKPEIKDTVHDIWKSFEWTNDTTDNLIKVMYKEIEACRITRLTSANDYVRIIEAVLQKFKVEMQKLKNEYEKSKRNMLSDIEKKSTLFQEESMKNIEFMKLVNFLVSEKHAERNLAWLGEFMNKKDDDISKGSTKTEVIMVQTEVQLLKVWREYEEILKENAENTKILLIDNAGLQEKVQTDDTVILEKARQLDQLEKRIEYYKLKMKSLSTSYTLRDLRNERNELRGILEKENERQFEESKIVESQFRYLTLISNSVMQQIESIKTKGNKILTLHRNTSKFEIKQNTVQISQIRGSNKMLMFWKKFFAAEMVFKLMLCKKKKYKKEQELLKNLISQKFLNSNITAILNDVTRCNPHY